MTILGWYRRLKFLSQTSMWTTEVIGRKSRCQLILEIDALFGKRVHSARQPTRMLTDGDAEGSCAPRPRWRLLY